MIPGIDADGSTINSWGKITPDKPGTEGTAAPSGESPFEKMLNHSIKEIEMKEIHFKKDLFDSSLPGPAIIDRQGPAGKGGFKEILGTVLKHEGSAYVRRDAGRGASKFGILQSTAREFGYKGNVRNMTQADAEAIYKKIWDRSGAASLPYPLSLVHFDTYVNSPAAARKLLQKSGGDTDAYLEMRAQRYSRLAKLRPARYARYLSGWMNRISSLRAITHEYMMAKGPEGGAPGGTEDASA
ncbi:MAG TPA: glycosyl hydrolase 108 family protein [Dissulfurispiraceae bacterium]